MYAFGSVRYFVLQRKLFGLSFAQFKQYTTIYRPSVLPIFDGEI
jgi:hypothetical protein